MRLSPSCILMVKMCWDVLRKLKKLSFEVGYYSVLDKEVSSSAVSGEQLADCKSRCCETWNFW